MSDKWSGGVRSGSTSVSFSILARKVTDNTETTGKVAADVVASYWRQGGSRTAITVTDLAAVTDAYSSGGWKEVDSTNLPGIYRFDVPDAAFASGVDWVLIGLKVATSYAVYGFFPLTTNALQTGDTFARLGAPAGASVSADIASVKTATTDIQGRLPAALVSGRIIAKVEALDNAVITSATLAASVYDAISADLLDEVLAELTQGQPPATPKVREALMLLYMALRNERFATLAEEQIKNDAGTVICKAALTEVVNTSFTRAKLLTGP